MKTYQLHVEGEPKGQPRPRAFARKVGSNFVARVYDAGTAEGWKSMIALEAKKAGLAGVMLEGPVSLEVSLHFRRPKSHYRTGRNKDVLREAAPKFYHTNKPDLDNVLKAVKDCLTRIGAWKDDSLVARSVAAKRWDNHDCTFIWVTQLEKLPNNVLAEEKSR